MDLSPVCILLSHAMLISLLCVCMHVCYDLGHGGSSDFGCRGSKRLSSTAPASDAPTRWPGSGRRVAAHVLGLEGNGHTSSKVNERRKLHNSLNRQPSCLSSVPRPSPQRPRALSQHHKKKMPGFRVWVRLWRLWENGYCQT